MGNGMFAGLVPGLILVGAIGGGAVVALAWAWVKWGPSISIVWGQ